MRKYSSCVGSKIYDGVRFSIFVADHLPRHAHGYWGEVMVVVDLLPDNKVAKSKQRRAVLPSNAKQSDVRRILTAHAAELNALWEMTHGPTS